MKSINPIKMGAQSTIACFGYGGVNSQTSKAREFYTTFIKEKVHSAESLSVQVLYDFCVYVPFLLVHSFIGLSHFLGQRTVTLMEVVGPCIVKGNASGEGRDWGGPWSCKILWKEIYWARL